MKKRLFSIGLVAAALVFPLTLYVKISHAHPAVKQVNPKIVNVKVATATELVVPETISAVGHIRAIKSVALAFQLDGQLTKIYKQAARVKQGELLATLDNASDLAQLKADTATLSLATTTYQRYLQLAKAGDESKQVLEQKKEAMVTAEAAVEKDKVTLKQKDLRAPFDGVLGSTDYSAGAYLPKGTVLFDLVQLAPVKARYSIPASLKNELEIGQAITVTNDTDEGKTFDGIVSFISPNVNSSSGTITIDATLKNPDYLLSPGMFVSIEQVLDPSRELLMVPDIALMTDVKGRYVFLVEGDTVQKRYIKVGLISDNLADVTSGLKAGDVVVTAGQQRLEDGNEIKIIGHMPTQLSQKKKAPKPGSPVVKTSSEAQADKTPAVSKEKTTAPVVVKADKITSPPANDASEKAAVMKQSAATSLSAVHSQSAQQPDDSVKTVHLD